LPYLFLGFRHLEKVHRVALRSQAIMMINDGTVAALHHTTDSLEGRAQKDLFAAGWQGDLHKLPDHENSAEREQAGEGHGNAACRQESERQLKHD
jgi:hypothetical protein